MSATVETPTMFPPLRFGMVNSGVYRGGYPVLRNFKFLYKTGIKAFANDYANFILLPMPSISHYNLRLQTILSLIPEQPTKDLQMFAKLANVHIIHIPVSRIVNLNSPTLISSLLRALSALINSANYPLYVHCLDGRRITSLLVLLTRRLQCWSCSFAFAEYWKYQICWKSSVGILDIEKQTSEIEKVFYNSSHGGSAITSGSNGVSDTDINSSSSSSSSNSGGGGMGGGGQNQAQQNVFELIIPAEYASWLWVGLGSGGGGEQQLLERGQGWPAIPGWKFIQETGAVSITPGLSTTVAASTTGTSAGIRERPVSSGSPAALLDSELL